MTEADFNGAYYQHKDLLYRFACRMTGSGTSAEDIVQDCFAALWNRRAAYDPERGPLKAFLLGIARNLVLKRHRDERPQDPLEDDILISGPIDLERLQRAEAVAKAVQLLPALQREVLVLAEYEGLSLEEICLATDAELAAVKSRLHRARENLRRMLRPLLEGKPEGRNHTYGT